MYKFEFKILPCVRVQSIELGVFGANSCHVRSGWNPEEVEMTVLVCRRRLQHRVPIRLQQLDVDAFRTCGATLTQNRTLKTTISYTFTIVSFIPWHITQF